MKNVTNMPIDMADIVALYGDVTTMLKLEENSRLNLNLILELCRYYVAQEREIKSGAV